MRTYKLQIGSLINPTVFELNADNPGAPGIKFSIQQFEAQQTSLSYITLYNMPNYFYGQFSQLFNKKVSLWGGFARSPITTRLGYTPTKELLLQGYITSIVPDYNNIDKPIMLITSPVPLYDGTKLDSASTKTALSAVYKLSIKIGDDAISALKSAFTFLTGGEIPLNSFVLNPVISQSTTTADVTSIFQLAEIAKSQFGLEMYQNIGEYVIVDPSIPSGIKLPIAINQSEFLTQPSSLTPASIAITLALRGDIKVQDKIMLPPGIFVGLTSFTDIPGMSGNAMFLDKSIYSFFSGVLNVIKVWHTGDSRNPDVQAWATHLEATTIL